MLLACSDAIRRITVGPLWRWLLHAHRHCCPVAALLFSGVRQPAASESIPTAGDVVFDAAGAAFDVTGGHGAAGAGDRTTVGRLVLFFPPHAEGAGVYRAECDQTIPSRRAVWPTICAVGRAGETVSVALPEFGVAGTGMTPALTRGALCVIAAGAGVS